MSNPFNFGTPVSPNRMVGRWDQVESTARSLVNLGGLSHIIIGGRRFGKSSFLEALRYFLMRQIDQERPDDWYFIPILVNLQRLASHSPEGVFGLMLKLLYTSFEPPSLQKALGASFSLDLVGTKLYAYRPDGQRTCDLDEFFLVIDELLNVFLKHHGNLRIIFLIDEIEITVDKIWTEMLFNQLRSLINEGPLKDYIRYVIVGSSKVIDVRETGSPLLNMLDVSHLAALCERDILKIINLAQDVPTDVASAVIQQCGGHPYIAQYLMYRIWEYGVSKTTHRVVMELASRFMSERNADLKRWKLEIGEAGQMVYAVLAEANSWLTPEQVRQFLNIPGLDIQRWLDTLCYHGLAIRDDEWYSYRVSGELFKRWFKHNALPSWKGLIDDPQLILYPSKMQFDVLAREIGETYTSIQRDAPGKATTPTREQIFVSYSHKDKKWLEKLLTMLKPLEKRGLIKTWSDTMIEPGTKWSEEINKALASAKVAILLVTPDFLASDFIANNELPPLLEAAEKEGLTILWMAVSYSMYKMTEIAAFQAVNNPAEPLDSLVPSKVNRELVLIAEKIKEIVSKA